MPVREILFYEFDDFSLDVKKEELRKNGNPVPLTHKAFQVLLILVQNFGQTVEKENIYQQLWADSFVEDANLTQHIYILRKTLGQMPSGESYIETVARSGYRFGAQVKTVFASPNSAPSELLSRHRRFPAETASDNYYSEVVERPRLTLLRNDWTNGDDSDLHSSVQPQTGGLRNIRREFLIGFAAMAVLVAVGLVIRFYVSPPSPGAAPAKSLAVLPFKTIGNESSNEKLGLGMADAIITRLGRLKTIPVRPTSAVFHYTDNPADSSLVAGHELSVDSVLEGTVQREGDRVRVSVMLIDISDGNTLWAENFDENSGDIFKLQDVISSKVVRALRINLTPKDETTLWQHSTSNSDAYQAFQQGVYFGNTRTKDGMEKAVSFFQKATEADPNYARAYAMLADTYNMLAYYRFADPYEMMKKASDAANKALELDDNISEAYVAEAYLKRFEKDGQPQAKQLLEKAIEIAPYNSNARVRYGWMLLNEENLDGAVEQMRLAQQYDPVSMVSNGALCQVLDYQKKFDEAIKFCEKSAEISPDLAEAKITLAEVYFAAGRHDDAVSTIEKLISTQRSDDRLSPLGSLGYFQAKLGNRQKAEEIMAELKPNSVRIPYLLNDLITINYVLGNREAGFAYFQQLRKRGGVAPFRVFYDPDWEEVRTDERVIEAMKNPSSD